MSAENFWKMNFNIDSTLKFDFTIISPYLKHSKGSKIEIKKSQFGESRVLASFDVSMLRVVVSLVDAAHANVDHHVMRTPTRCTNFNQQHPITLQTLRSMGWSVPLFWDGLLVKPSQITKQQPRKTEKRSISSKKKCF